MVPYRATSLAWGGTTRRGRPWYFPLWWASWVLAQIHIPFTSTHPTGTGWSQLDPVYRRVNAASAIVLGVLTLLIVHDLARQQDEAAATRGLRSSTVSGLGLTTSDQS